MTSPTKTNPVTTWPNQSHQYILWDDTGFATTDKVKITLVNDTPTTGAWETIIASEVHAINDSYEWNKIDIFGPTGSKFKIRIDSIGISPSVSNTSGYFTITTSPPTINGKLQCNSVPTGANITGDNGFRAQTTSPMAPTNTLIPNLRPGNYYVTVWNVTGYNDKTQMVTIPANGGTRASRVQDA